MDTYTKWCHGSVLAPEIARADAVQQEYCDLPLTGLAAELAPDLSEHHRINATPRSAIATTGRVRGEQFRILPDPKAVEPVLPSRHAGFVTARRPS